MKIILALCQQSEELLCSSLGAGKPSRSLSGLRFVAHEYDAQPSLHHPIYSALDTK